MVSHFLSAVQSFFFVQFLAKVQSFFLSPVLHTFVESHFLSVVHSFLVAQSALFFPLQLFELTDALYNSPPAIPSTKAIKSFLEVVFHAETNFPE